MTHALCRLRDEGGIFSVYAAHFNHGIRGEAADEDEAFCRALPALCGVVAIPVAAFCSAERDDVRFLLNRLPRFRAGL